MEKFAIDLDKVLDDFEFNEDCAEQIASVNPVNNNASSSTVKCSMEPSVLKNYNYLLIEPQKANNEFDIGLPLERHKDLEQESANDTKTIEKESVSSYNADQVPLTIHNDISQKLIPKRQNGSSSPKIDIRYDKKWNQFNVKPSVSNVFNSLNEYINAPPGSSDCIHSALDEPEIEPDLETQAICHSSEVPNLIQSTIKITDNSLAIQQIPDVVDSSTETSILNHQESRVLVSLELPTTQEYSIKEDSVQNINVESDEKIEMEPKVSKIVAESEVELSNKMEDAIEKEDISNSYDNINDENNSIHDTQAESLYTEEDLATKLQTKVKLSIENPTAIEQQRISLDPGSKPIGFGTINNLSEVELTKYLAELEEEEALNEICNKHKDISQTVQDVCEKQKGEKKQIVQSFTDIVAGVSKTERVELNQETRNTSHSDCKREQVDKKVLDNELDVQNEQHDDDAIENKDSDILNNLSNTDAKLFHINDQTTSHTIMVQEIPAPPESGCLPKAKMNKDSQEISTNNLNINEGSDECEIEMQLKTQPGHSAHHTYTCELKMQTDTDSNASEERNSMTPEIKILNDKTNNTDDVKATSAEVSRSNVNDIDDDSEKPVRPQTLDIALTNNNNDHQTLGSTSDTSLGQAQSDADGTKEEQESSPDILENSLPESSSVLGKQPPFWVPDSDAPCCMLCDVKFTVLKRRHHCRACGKVLCNKCCKMKYKLEYQGNIDSRVCVSCYQLLTKAETENTMEEWSSGYSTCGNNFNSPQGRQPNPNNPMEYCSTIPPLQQLAGGLPPPPSVMVPVGVLKREGGAKNRPEISKCVMFSDGIRPGCDLTELDMSWDLKPPYRKPGNKRALITGSSVPSTSSKKQNLPRLDPNTESFVPRDPAGLPPTVTIHKGQVSYQTIEDEESLYKTLKNECEPPIMFAINRNLYAYVKIITLNCCINKICWNVTSKGLACVGQDEVILLIEVLPDEIRVPKDLLLFINQLYLEALKENTVSELGFSVFQGGNLLDSREHAGFLFIRRTLQCLQKIILPSSPYLIGLLIHRWETPWAKVFPLRLVLRLGAEYRYYPCPLFSVRFRDALYFEIGHTIMKVLADFRNFAYTLPGVRGLTIHLSNRRTDVMFPKKRYDQVIKGLNNSNDHVLAYASNFSIAADSHLVCIQTNTGDESTYQTQAISMNNHPRTVTGTSFIVINGALKSSMGLSAKSSIVEDGLMVEIMPEKMEALKAALKNMQDFSIGCGRQGAPEPDETVNIKWIDNDADFNIGVKSPIDGQPMDGIPSMRVRNGTDYKGTSRFIRWTEVFVIHSDDRPNGVHDPIDISKLSGNIAKATCMALVKLLDLLANAGLTKLGVRTNIHPDNVGYEAGSEGMKLPPIYMNSLDNELIQVLHKAAQNSQDTHTVLELIFYILDD